MAGTNETCNILMKHKCQLTLKNAHITQSTPGKQRKVRSKGVESKQGQRLQMFAFRKHYN